LQLVDFTPIACLIVLTLSLKDPEEIANSEKHSIIMHMQAAPLEPAYDALH
jgi:hypothetical protein